MKKYFRIGTSSLLFVIVLVNYVSGADSQSIKSDEIARHFGMHWWRIERANLPVRFQCRIAFVNKGVIGQDYLPPVVLDREGDLVVCSRVDNDLLMISIDNGKATYHIPRRNTRALDYKIAHELPEFASNGIYVLMGNYVKSDGRTTATGKVEDLANGLILILKERAEEPKTQKDNK